MTIYSERFQELCEFYGSQLKMWNEWNESRSNDLVAKYDLNAENLKMAARLAAIEQIAVEHKVLLDPTNKNTDSWLEENFNLRSKMSEGFEALEKINDEEVKKNSSFRAMEAVH